MEDKNQEQPVSRREFYDFLTNDFAHLSRAVSYIRGELRFLIPLTIGLMGGIITLIVLFLKG